MRTIRYHKQTSKVMQLPLGVRENIDKMIFCDVDQRKSYQEISDWLKRRYGYVVSKSSLARYFQYCQTNKGKGSTAFYNKHSQIRDRIETNLLNLYEALTKKASKSLDPKDIEQVLRLGETLEKSKGGE